MQPRRTPCTGESTNDPSNALDRHIQLSPQTTSGTCKRTIDRSAWGYGVVEADRRLVDEYPESWIILE